MINDTIDILDAEIVNIGIEFNLVSKVASNKFEVLEVATSALRNKYFNYVFDTSKSSGFPKRVMNITRAKDWINYHPSKPLLDGLKETWTWFQENQDEYLKRKNYFNKK